MLTWFPMRSCQDSGSCCSKGRKLLTMIHLCSGFILLGVWLSITWSYASWLSVKSCDVSVYGAHLWFVSFLCLWKWTWTCLGGVLAYGGLQGLLTVLLLDLSHWQLGFLFRTLLCYLTKTRHFSWKEGWPSAEVKEHVWGWPGTFSHTFSQYLSAHLIHPLEPLYLHMPLHIWICVSSLSVFHVV